MGRVYYVRCKSVILRLTYGWTTPPEAFRLPHKLGFVPFRSHSHWPVFVQVLTTVPFSTTSRATQTFLRAAASTSLPTLVGRTSSWPARRRAALEAAAFPFRSGDKGSWRSRRGQGGGRVRLRHGGTQMQSGVLWMHGVAVLCPDQPSCCMESVYVSCWVLRSRAA